MALTSAERTSLIELVVGMFNAAPGATYLGEVALIFEATNNNLTTVARLLAQTPVYKSLNSDFQTASEFATAFLTPLGLQGNTEATSYITQRLAAGASKGEIVLQGLAALNATSAPAFADARAILANKTSVAEYYSVTKAVAQSNLGILQASVATVTKDASSVTTAKTAIDSNTVGSGGGATFTLSVNAETFLGTSGSDTFNAADTTLGAADSLDGATGTDTLNFTVANTVHFPAATIKDIETINVRAVGGALGSIDLSLMSSVTTFNAERSTQNVTATNLGKGSVYGVVGDNSVSSLAINSFGYLGNADVATLNISGGTLGSAAVTLSGTGVSSTTINSTGAANTMGVIATPGTSLGVTINAATSLKATLSTTADTKLTVTGAGVVDLSAVALANNLTTIDAATQPTDAGLKIAAGNSTTIKFTGGAGTDLFKTGAVLATGAAVVGGAGTDTLVVTDATHVTATPAAFYSGFEVVSLSAGVSADLSLLATNNTLTGLILAGSSTVSNLNANTAGNVTVTGSSTAVFTVVGATTPGQLDTLKLIVDDGVTAMNTLTLTAPGATGVETLALVANDNATITSLANLGALTALNGTGAGTVNVTTTAIALNSGLAIDFSGATGAVTLDATGATGNGFTFKGSSGVNILTGGSKAFTVDLAKSTAKADVLVITNATDSGYAQANAIISSFTNAASTGDKIDVLGTATITANVAAGAATGITNLTAAITSGVITFAGTAAATATLQNKIDAAAGLAGATQYNVLAFEHSGNTYVFEQGDTTATFAAGTDVIIQLTGVTGVTALSTTASAANTVWVA